MPRFARIVAVVALWSVVVQASFAQDPSAANAQDPSAANTDPPDAQVRQLNELAVRGDMQLADAISSFARIRRWQDADRWLIRGVAPIAEQPRLAAIANRIGADNLFKLSSSPSITDAARDAIKKLGQASRAQAESKDRLTKAIDNLDDPSVDVRLEASRRVLAGGRVALGMLIEAAVAENPPAPRAEILKTMVRLGGDGTQALTQLAIYGAGDVRRNALESITRIDRKAALVDLMTAIHAADSTEAEAAFARTNVTPIMPVPSRQQVQRRLYSDLLNQRRFAAETENDLSITTLWTVGTDRKTVSSQVSRTMLLAYRKAVDAAARLRRVGGLSQEMADAAIAADLSYRTIVDPDWGREEQVKELRTAYGDALSPAGLSRAIQLALDSDDRPALVGLLRMVGAPSDQHSLVQEMNTLLLGSSPNRTPLVMATLNAEPRVRYEAAAAILRLNPPASYAGSSYVKRCLAEMTRLEDRPLAILVETRGDVALRQERILSKMGLKTELVGSVLGLERCVHQGGDLRLILSKTQLADVPPVEMVDRVRRMPNGKNVPIIFFGGLIDEAAMKLAERRLAERAKDADVIVQAELSALSREREVGSRFAVLLERLSYIGDSRDWREEQAKLDTLIASRERLTELVTTDSLNAWEAAIEVAREKIKLSRFRSDEDSPIVEPTLIAEDLGITSSRWSGISRLIARPKTPAAFGDLLMDLDLVSRLPEMTELDRSHYRRIASEYLSR